jgi:hypothetical protein
MHLDPDKLLITLKNTARAEFEKDVVLQIEGYAKESERDARTYHAGSAANEDVILLAEFRVLAGISSQR